MLANRRKNSEKRKEKSRYAARARRSRESDIFNEMSALLPLHQTIDKASTMRLAISLIQTRNLMEKCIYGQNDKHDTLSYDLTVNLGLIDTSLFGVFLIVLTSDGHIPYISENVEKYLGLKQIDLLGTSIFEFSHPCDHNDIRDVLTHKYHNGSIPSPFLIRIKCTITSKGKTTNLKSAAYKVIKLTGHWIGDKVCGYLCLVGEPLTCPAKVDDPIADQIFLSRHSPDMKFTDIDERFTKILGYEQKDLIGKSVYNLFHALDCLDLSDCFRTLFVKGQSETGYYRLLAKRGGYIWFQTQATLITDNHTQQPISIVCVNYALSGIENQEEIISEEQCQERQKESYHLVDKTNDVLIKLATSTLIDTNTDTEERITVTTISDNNSNTSNSIQNSLIDTAQHQQHRQQQQQQQNPTCDSNNNQEEFIKSLSDYQLPSGILIDTEENFLNPLGIDQSTSSCFAEINSLINQEDTEQQQYHHHCQQQQLKDQPCSQGQLLDNQYQNQIEQSVPIQPLSPSTSFLFTPIAGNSLPTPATATIFAPRTADMNPGFLMPIGNDDDNDFGLTVLPDIEACDPEQDLTHLAPQAGDYCVPLEIGSLPSFDGFSMDDILKEMGFVTNTNVTTSSSSTTTTTTSSSSSSLSATSTTLTSDTTSALVSGSSNDSVDQCIMVESKSDTIDNIVRNSSASSSTPSSKSPLCPSTILQTTKSSILSCITSIITDSKRGSINDTLSDVIKSNEDLMTPIATTTPTIIAVTGITSNIKESDLLVSSPFPNNNCDGGSLIQSTITTTSSSSSPTTTNSSINPLGRSTLPTTTVIVTPNAVDSNVNSSRNSDCSVGAVATGTGCINVDDHDNDDGETLNFTDYLPTDSSKLLPFIPTAVAEEEIQFSCNDDIDLTTTETRGSIDPTVCTVDGGVGVDDNGLGDANSLSDFLCNQRLIEPPPIINQRGAGNGGVGDGSSLTAIKIPITTTTCTSTTRIVKMGGEGEGGNDGSNKSIKNGMILPEECTINKKDETCYNGIDGKCDFTSGEEADIDGDDDNVSSICSPASGGSGVACNSSTGNLLLGMALNNNRHGINESSSPLHNDPFLSFTNGIGGLVNDNYLCSLSSSSSSSSSPSNFYVSSSRLTSSSPDFTLTSGSIHTSSHQLNTKRPSSLCDSPPPSSCNSTLTSDLDLCGSFAPEDEDEFDSLGGRSGCGGTGSGGNGRSDRLQRHYDDEFPLLPNDESIWDTFIHSNDINDMINSDELLSSASTHFPIDDYRLISVTKDNTVKSSTSSSSSSLTATTTPTPITANNSISSSPSSISPSSSSLSSSSSLNNLSNGASGGSNDTNNNDNNGANDSFLLNSNLAMLLQGKDTSLKNCYTLSNGDNDKSNVQTPSQYQQSAVAMAAATASRNRFHNYSANLPKTPSTAPCSSSSTSTSSSSVDNSRINSNYVIVQNNRPTIKTSSNHSNGTKDITKSAQNNLQNCDMSRNEIDRKSDYFTLDSEMKKYRSMADSVYSKLGPSYVKIARKLAYNSSSSSSSSSSMPSPKRAYLPSKSSMENNYKRMKLPSTLPSMQGTSVLMNLLVNGEDVTNGYSRFQQQSHLKSSSINVNIG